jgi:glycerophosphoryl diester phosphodiesterase
MTRVYAHRGARHELPENTLQAFRRGLDVGADALELDCHMTRDGIIVVSHDETGARMGNVASTIRSSSFADLREWDVGLGFLGESGERPFKSAGFRIPALAEVLAEFSGVRLNIDAKQEEPDMIPALLRAIRNARAEEYVHLASFSSKNLGKIRNARYAGGTSLSASEVAQVRLLPLSVLRVKKPRGERAQIPRSHGRLRLDSVAFIEKCHALGVAVDYWTINDADEARLLVSRRADGIVTDDPRRIVAALRSAGGT